MLEAFKHIRIYVTAGPGHGSSAANLHLLKWIVSQGFTGSIDIIYDVEAAHKVKVVFDLPDHFFANAIYHAEKERIQFISVPAYLAIRDTLSEADFGFKAAGLSGVFTDIAYFLKANIALALIPFQNMGQRCVETINSATTHYMVQRNSSRIIPLCIGSLPIRYPVPKISDALALLDRAEINNPHSMRLQHLSQLLGRIVRGDIIAWPIYGLHNTFKLPVEDILLKLMLTIHTLHKQGGVTKPVMMMLFNNLPKKTFTHIQSTIEKLAVMYPDSETSPPLIKDLITAIGTLNIVDINAANTSDVLTQSYFPNITMMNIGRTEATIFEALLTYVNGFVFPPVIEGANAENLLHNKGIAGFSMTREGCRFPFRSSFKDMPATAANQLASAVSCTLSSPLQLKPAEIMQSQLEIDNLVYYSETINAPSLIQQRLTLANKNTDRFSAGVQHMLTYRQLPTKGWLTETLQAQLLNALELNDTSTINTILTQYDITRWYDLTSRRFLWTLFVKGYWDIFEKLTSAQLNQTVIHIPFAAHQDNPLYGFINYNNIKNAEIYHDAAFPLSHFVESIKRIGTEIMLKTMDYVLLMMAGYDSKALSLTDKQADIFPFIDACIKMNKAYLLDELPYNKTLPEFKKIVSSPIFSSITPRLLHAWKEYNITQMYEAKDSFYINNLLLNESFDHLIDILGNIALPKKFILSDRLFRNQPSLPLDGLIERIHFLLSVATQKQKINIIQSVTFYATTYLNIEECEILTKEFNLSFNISYEEQPFIFHDGVKSTHFVHYLNSDVCMQLSTTPELAHFIENSFRRGECQKLIGLQQQCGINTTQLQTYITHCKAIETATLPDQAEIHPVNELPTERTLGVFSQFDHDYPSFYAFGLSFIKAMLETSLTHRQLCSERQAQIIIPCCMIFLGALFTDWSFMLTGFISIILTCLLPKQTVWPIALVIAGVGRDIYQGVTLVESLTSNSQRMLTSVVGDFAGKSLVTRFKGKKEHTPQPHQFITSTSLLKLC